MGQELNPVEHLRVQEQRQSFFYIWRLLVYDPSDKMKTVEGQYQ